MGGLHKQESPTITTGTVAPTSAEELAPYAERSRLPDDRKSVSRSEL